MNRFVTNTSYRERSPNYIPLPFAELNQALQQKQQDYDTAEDLEIKAKASVSALTSPISGYQEYYDQVKTDFLDKAMTLHKSTPDKGSSEFNRKLKELISTVEADRTLLRIQRDSELYTQFIKDKADLLKQGKYSNWRNAQYEGFTGKDPKTGTILPFTYTGVQAAKDVDNLINQSIDNVQPEDREVQTYDKTGTKKIKVKITGKDPFKIKQSIIANLGEDGLRDWQEKKGYKDINAALDALAKTSGGLRQSYSEDYDFSAENNMRERFNFAKENAPEETIIPISTGEVMTYDPLKEVRNNVSKYINEYGEIKHEAPDFKMTMFGLDITDPFGEDPKTKGGWLEKNKKEFISQLPPETWNNFRKQSKTEDEALKKAIKFISNQDKEGFNMHKISQIDILDPKMVSTLQNKLQEAKFFDLKGNPLKSNPLIQIKGDKIKEQELHPVAELLPNPLSLQMDEKGNQVANRTYKVVVNGQTLLATIPTNDPTIYNESLKIKAKFAGQEFGGMYTNENGEMFPYTTKDEFLNKQ